MEIKVICFEFYDEFGDAEMKVKLFLKSLLGFEEEILMIILKLIFYRLI